MTMRTQFKKGLENAPKLTRYLKSFGMLLVMVFLTSGCALTKDYVVLSYDPQTNVEKMKGADGVKVKVEISDIRTVRDKVSSKKNSYGMEMAPIIAQNDIGDLLKKAIEAELKNRGFEVADGSVQVLAELNKYYSDFKTGFWAGKAVAEVVVNIQVKKPDKSILYSKLVTGENALTVQLASGKNAKLALDAALKDAMSKLFADAAFMDSCFKACLAE
jgi:uncharacterized lipoprotein YajG